ncbi:MAG: hypothetical protein ACRDB0_02840 [Paraclostridium sp.]
MEDIQKLYELYSKDIYKFILSLSKDKYIAEDIMQSTFKKKRRKYSREVPHVSKFIE